MSKYHGVWPVAPTPFTETGELDLEGMKRVLECMIDQGVDGICILANYSEQFLLSDDERRILTRLCLEQISGRVPVIVTISHFSTDIAVARAQEAKSMGAEIVMMMPPYHGALMRATADQTMEQFSAVSQAGIPIMVQDAPISGVDFPVPLLLRMLSEIEQVTCLKIECPQAAAKLRTLIGRAGDSIDGPFDGEEGITLLADMEAGATGNMSSALLPDLIRPVVNAYLDGRRDEAEDQYSHILPLINYENKQCGFRGTKAVMMAGGVIKSDHCRHPIPPLTPETRAGLLKLAGKLNPIALNWGK